MNNFKTIFHTPKPIVGMVHLRALPGTPKYENNINAIIIKAVEEALVYQKAGVNGLLIENMHDVPYLKNEVGPEISSLMTIIGYEIKNKTQLPCGVQVLSSANEAALAIAHSAGLDFIRAEGFVFGHLADEGYVDSCAGGLLRYRKKIGAESVAIFTDIKKKHSSHALTADVNIVETAKAAEYFLSEGLIITGSSTGQTPDLDEIRLVKENVNIPVLIGSGINLENIKNYWPVCDAMIVGSHFKKNNFWANELDAEKIFQFMMKVNELRLLDFN
ncbi:MAG: BtpA/SgcQ family protein [Bacteroidota bacterium]